MAQDERRLVRGSVINGWLKYIKKKWGSEGLEECLADISHAEPFKDSKFYPLKKREDILVWISQKKGMKYVTEGGAFIPQHLGLLSWLSRLTSLEFMAKRLKKNYSEVYNFGRMDFKFKNGEPQFIRIHDTAPIEEVCRAWEGVFNGIVEVTGDKGTFKEVKCQCKGDDYCEFRFET